jgi:Spy/CpxP family protein refolding chaperone
MRYILVAFLMTALAGTLAAQIEMPIPGRAAERLEQFKKLRLMEVLKLDEETSIKFFARYNKQRDELMELNQKRNTLLDELAKLRREDASDKEFQKVLDELRGMGDPAVEIRVKFFDDISKILTTKQMADYLVFERNFIRNVREIMREMQGQRMRGGPPR